MKTALMILSLLISTNTLIYAGQLKTKNISGKIVDFESSKPLSGVTVTLDDENFVLGTISNDKGEFRLWKIPNKCNSLKISLDGYHSSTVSIEHLKEITQDGVLVIKLEGIEKEQKQIGLNNSQEKE